MAPRYYTVTWDQLHRDAKALAWRLVDAGPWKGMVAITRGGLIPSAIISRELECRLIETVSIVTYDEEQRGDAQRGEAAGRGAGRQRRGLADRRRPGGHRHHRAGGPRHAAQGAFRHRLCEAAGQAEVDTFITEVSQDTWILFPWDTEPQFVAPIAKSHANGG